MRVGVACLDRIKGFFVVFLSRLSTCRSVPVPRNQKLFEFIVPLCCCCLLELLLLFFVFQWSGWTGARGLTPVNSREGSTVGGCVSPR